MEWQIFARGQRAPGYTTVQRGDAEVTSTTLGVNRILWQRAFARSARGLLADQGFVAFVSGTSPAGAGGARPRRHRACSVFASSDDAFHVRKSRVTMRKLGALLLLSLVIAACGNEAGFDRTLKVMEGSSEAQLISAMRRPPDSSVDSQPGVKILQWRRDATVSYSASSGSSMVVGGTFYYLPGAPARTEREQCLVEWTIVRGIATKYRSEGQCLNILRAPADAQPTSR